MGVDHDICSNKLNLKPLHSKIKEKPKNITPPKNIIKFTDESDFLASERASYYNSTNDFFQKVHHEIQQNSQYIIFNNKEEFESWENLVSMRMGLPKVAFNGATGALSYMNIGAKRFSDGIKHPEDERYLTPASETIAYGHKLVSKQFCIDEGW